MEMPCLLSYGRLLKRSCTLLVWREPPGLFLRLMHVDMCVPIVCEPRCQPPSVYPSCCDSWENRWHSGTGSRASLHTGPLLCCHLTGMAQVLIRGSMDTTLHLPPVTQPRSTDADEVDVRNRRRGLLHLPPLLSSPVSTCKTEERNCIWKRVLTFEVPLVWIILAVHKGEITTLEFCFILAQLF